MTYEKFTLENGLRVLVQAMPHTRSVAINYFIGAGSRYETARQAGISHYIEHVCFKGTRKRPTSTDIASVIEGVGGMLNAGTDKELTVYWCKVAQPHFETAFDVMSDIVLNSVFDAGEIEKERPVIVEEINMSLDSPSQRVSMLIDDLMWPGHPLGRDIAGSQESVAGLSRRMMLDYMDRQYRPHNAVLTVAGNVRPEAVREAALKATAGWADGRTPIIYKPYRTKAGRRVHIEKKETEQTQLCLALPGLSIRDADRFKLDLLNIVFGEGMSSRLFTEIRDKLGLCYSIQSYAEHFLDTGAMIISAGVDNRNLKVAVAAVINELARLREGIPEAELSKAKELFKGRLMLRMEDSRNVAGWLGTQELLLGEILSVDDVIRQVEAITSAEVRAVAERLLKPRGLRLAAVGPLDPDQDWEALLKF